jgi:peptide/nickel transport system permease protein
VLPAFGAAGVDREFLSPVGRALDSLRHLALPLLTLTVIGVGGIARYVRGAMADVRGSRFLTVAAAKGLGRRDVLLRHALPNAVIPVLVLLGLSLPALFSGAVFVEAIFAWPGVGRMLVEAVQARDYPVVLAATTISAGLVVMGNLLADALVTLADPRLRDQPGA